jgi:hypothetical protein
LFVHCALAFVANRATEINNRIFFILLFVVFLQVHYVFCTNGFQIVYKPNGLDKPCIGYSLAETKIDKKRQKSVIKLLRNCIILFTKFKKKYSIATEFNSVLKYKSDLIGNFFNSNLIVYIRNS